MNISYSRPWIAKNLKNHVVKSAFALKVGPRAPNNSKDEPNMKPKLEPTARKSDKTND